MSNPSREAISRLYSEIGVARYLRHAVVRARRMADRYDRLVRQAGRATVDDHVADRLREIVRQARVAR